ncbi:MAG: hypothetical protein GQ570_10080 [Helicobacteraceae bacterium]|nr:hypothetical protein [Helicobacteraceae bacterium]
MTNFTDKKVYFDTNILMDEQFTSLMNSFINNNIKINIIMPKVQYDEIYNLRQNSNEAKSYKARTAFNAIEKLLDHNIICIEGLNKKQKKEAYADPEFIKMIILDIKNNQNVIFLTEDIDLRIRLKGLVKEFQVDMSKLEIYSLKDFPYYKKMQEDAITEMEKRYAEEDEIYRKLEEDTTAEANRAYEEKRKKEEENDNGSLLELVGMGVVGAIALYHAFTS